MDYGKIRQDKSIQKQGNPVYVSISNPSECQKSMMAELRGELELVYTSQPQYNTETQYVTEYWEEENGKAVQHWEIHEIPPEPENTEEQLVN